MTNIFEILQKTDDEFIRQYIAMLEVLNPKNTAKIGVNIISRKGVQFINKLGHKFNKDLRLKAPKPQNLEQYIDQKKQELSNLSRSKLNTKLKIILKSILSLSYTISDDSLSIQIIDFVSQKLKIDEYKLVSQRADDIYLQYFNKLVEEDKHILTLNKMSHTILKNVLLKEDLWAHIMAAHGFKTEIMSQLIFMTVAIHGSPFTPAIETLPSYEADESIAAEIASQEDAYTQLLIEHNRLKIRLKNSETKYDQTLKDISTANATISAVINEQAAAESELAKLTQEYLIATDELNSLRTELQNENLSSSASTTFDLLHQKYKAKDLALQTLQLQIDKQAIIISSAKDLIPDKKLGTTQLELHSQDILQEITKVKTAIKHVNADITSAEVQKRFRLEPKWQDVFSKFTFSSASKNKLPQFATSEILAIELALTELQNISDKTALSKGQSFFNGTHYQYFTTKADTGKIIKILYNPITADTCEIAQFAVII